VNGDLLAGSHNILNRSMNYICYPLNIHGINIVKQIEIRTVVPESSSFKIKIAIEKLKRY